jgi:NADH dehydrogenase FAD-containing subunit
MPILSRVRRAYGAHPLHLLALLCCFALAGYAALRTVTDPKWPVMLAWFAAAVIGHDLVLFPLYALADRSVTSLLHALRPLRRWRPENVRSQVPSINYIRVPALGAGLTFVVFLPGIIQQGARAYHSATGLTQQPYLGRWLLLCAAMFGAGAVAYAIRLRRASTRSDAEGNIPADVVRARSRSAVPVARGALAGLIAGVVVGAILAEQDMFTQAGNDLAAVLGYGVYTVVIGAALGALVRRDRPAPALATSGGVLLGGLGWLVFSLTVTPLLHGAAPTWSVGAAVGAYPDFVGDVLHGALTGVVLSAFVAVGRSRTTSPSTNAAPAPARTLSRVVIVGGGFAGISAAQRFERLVLRGAPVDVTLISDSNFLLFTPMLAEAAAGALEARHISTPVRAAVSHTRFRHGTVQGVDTNARTVRITVGTGASERIPYDHLVLAAGSVAHTLGLPGVADHAWTLKNLGDATRLRDHVLALLELAEQEPDPAERRRMLTFVVAGAGFAGTEMVAELFDLVHGVSHFYPAIGPDDSRFVLVHPGDRILPELTPELAGFALQRLRARGIECVLGTRVVEAAVGRVRLSNDDRVETRTFVWTAGNRPHPLVADLTGQDADSAVLATDPSLRVSGLEGVWAIGDCARIPDLDNDGMPFPPTAQHAVREGRAVADNIAAVLAGRPPAEFRFRTIGVLVALGRHTAAGDIRGHRFSGFAAWLLWRGIYLSKLPGIDKRIRVLLDWLLDLAFPRDIVVTATRPDAGVVADSGDAAGGAGREPRLSNR